MGGGIVVAPLTRLPMACLHSSPTGESLMTLGGCCTPYYGKVIPLFLVFLMSMLLTNSSVIADNASGTLLKIGWSEVDVTPSEPVLIGGQFYARISEGIKDPITATVLVFESVHNRVSQDYSIMVSFDFSTVSEGMRDSVRDHLKEVLPEIDPMKVIFNATHTHSAPYIRTKERYDDNAEPSDLPYGIDLDAMPVSKYVAFASARIANAIQDAWVNRSVGGVSYGLGHAVIGQNRLVQYADGASQLYGSTDHPDFSHMEGYDDHTMHILATYDEKSQLTGIVINIPCPSQANEGDWKLSADFWHDVRKELRSRLGDHVFIHAQTSAAGDQAPHVLLERRAEGRMRDLTGRTLCQELGLRIADGVTRVLPVIESEIDWKPAFFHHVEMLNLPRRMIPAEDVEDAAKKAAEFSRKYEQQKRELQENPSIRQQGRRWYKEITTTYRMIDRHAQVQRRFKKQQVSPFLPFEVHVVRLGDIAFATNPFELYLDFGLRIRERSRAVQTFIMQLSGPGSYLPTERSIAGGGYGAVPASTEVGPDAADILVEWTLGNIQRLMEQGPGFEMAPPEWKLVLSDDFDRDDIGKDWEVAEGGWTIQDGALVSEPGGGKVLTSRAYPGLHRIEIVAAAPPTQAGKVSDLSPLIHTGNSELRMQLGYMLQFGGRNNTRNAVIRNGTIVDQNQQLHITPGKDHLIVAEYDGKHVRLIVDNQVVLQYQEDQPLVNMANQRLGFYSWTGTRIRSIRIYTAAIREAIDAN